MRRFLLGITISFFLFVLVFRNTDWGQIATAFRTAHGGLLVLAASMTAVGLWIRARRWAVLFWPKRDLPTDALLDAINIGYLANNLLPTRLGDLLRSYLISEWAETGMARALSTTFFERVLDGLLTISLFFALLPFLSLPVASVYVGLIAGLTLAVVLAGLGLAAWQREPSQRGLARMLNATRRVNGEAWAVRLIGFLDGFAVVCMPRAMMYVGIWSVFVWADAILVSWLVMRAFALDISPAVAALTITAVALGLAIPAAPAALGAYEGAVTGALLLAGIESNLARSVALALHAVNFLTLCAAGIWSLARRGLKYHDLVRRAKILDIAP